jgi:hypothetical protein
LFPWLFFFAFCSSDAAAYLDAKLSYNKVFTLALHLPRSKANMPALAAPHDPMRFSEFGSVA